MRLIKCAHLTNLHTFAAFRQGNFRVGLGLGIGFELGLGLGLGLGLVLGLPNLPKATSTNALMA